MIAREPSLAGKYHDFIPIDEIGEIYRPITRSRIDAFLGFGHCAREIVQESRRTERKPKEIRAID
ncbi:MAG: hypothetical protein ACI9DC_004626 [Gammaproteobacteria bacterium]